jgi:hypothetical protein
MENINHKRMVHIFTEPKANFSAHSVWTDKVFLISHQSMHV